MPKSQALLAFRDALAEVKHLRKASPTRSGGTPRNPEITLAVGRACIVLLASHFERYFYAVNEEAISFVGAQVTDGTMLPKSLRLIHTRPIIDSIALIGWEHRDKQLEEFLISDGWLWSRQLNGDLDPSRILSWMKSPSPENLIRYYRYWGIKNIFSDITRKQQIKKKLFFTIRSLVEKRNNIVHGDIAEQVTPGDVRGYANLARDFCDRADRALARAIARTLRTTRPW